MNPRTTAAHHLVAVAGETLGGDPHHAEMLAALSQRLDEPLRLALVGSVKAGKSTLINALLGERLAPTDARECTRIVTWYRYGATPSMTVTDREGQVSLLTPHRGHDRFELDLGDIDPDTVTRIDIRWPSQILRDVTLIDTPGTESATEGVSRTTSDFLLPDVGAAGADAVVYVLRSLHASDVEFLSSLQDRTRHGASAVAAIAALSRVDEIASGPGTMMAVNETIDRLRRTRALDRLCETVLPLAGLLGLGAATMRQSDYAALAALTKVDRATLKKISSSPELFITAEGEGLPSQTVRASLVDRLGMLGISLSVSILNGGAADSFELCEELEHRSGLDELKRVISANFVQRSADLVSHSVVLAVLQLARASDEPGAADLIELAEEQLSQDHAFDELRLLGRLSAKRVELDRALREEMERLIGGRGAAVHERLGLDADADPDALIDQAWTHLARWRELAVNPLWDAATTEACQITARSCELLVGTTEGYEPVEAGLAARS